MRGDCIDGSLARQKCSTFRESAVQVRYTPALHQLIALNPVDGDALERDRLSGRSDAAESALVCSKESPPHDYLVTFRYQIVDYVPGFKYRSTDGRIVRPECLSPCCRPFRPIVGCELRRQAVLRQR